MNKITQRPQRLFNFGFIAKARTRMINLEFHKGSFGNLEHVLLEEADLNLGGVDGFKCI